MSEPPPQRLVEGLRLSARASEENGLGDVRTASAATARPPIARQRSIADLIPIVHWDKMGGRGSKPAKDVEHRTA